jgi:hypothetical protein
MLAVAAAKESRRVRKLEKAHIRRQRIEAAIATARLAASLGQGPSVKAPKARPAGSTGDTGQKAAPVKARPARTPAKAPAKAAPAKAAPVRTPARAVRAKTPAKAAAKAAPTKAPAKAERPKTPATTPPATTAESPTEP